MGCSTSSQTTAVDTARPSIKPQESNGASTTGEQRSFALVCNLINMLGFLNMLGIGIRNGKLKLSGLCYVVKSSLANCRLTIYMNCNGEI